VRSLGTTPWPPRPNFRAWHPHREDWLRRFADQCSFARHTRFSMARPRRRLLKALFGFTFGFVLTADDRRSPEPAARSAPPAPGPQEAESCASGPLEQPEHPSCKEGGTGIN
jgi:hypothetical protein